MVWYMNFCMPFLANDPAVNLVRMALIGEVAVLLLLFSIIKIAATCKGVDAGNPPSLLRQAAVQRREGQLREFLAQRNLREEQRGWQGRKAIGPR